MNQLSRIIAAAGACVAMTSAAFAQAYPTKPITVVTAFGGGGEQLVRVLAAKMSEHLGHPIVIVPEPAAAGVIAATRVARAEPDGYTLLAGNTGAMVLRPLGLKSIGYNPTRDFTPISQATAPVLVLAVGSALPIRNMKELAEYTKKNPGNNFIGVSGVGSSADLSVMMLRDLGMREIQSASYKDDNQPLIDAVGGRVLGVVGAGSSVKRFVQAGTMRVIGVLADDRQVGWEDVPTVSEQIPAFKPLRPFMGFFGPAGLPAPVVQRLNDAITRTLADPGVRTAVAGFGSNPRSSTPDQLGQLVSSEYVRTGELLKQAGIKPE